MRTNVSVYRSDGTNHMFSFSGGSAAIKNVLFLKQSLYHCSAAPKGRPLSRQCRRKTAVPFYFTPIFAKSACRRLAASGSPMCMVS